MKQEMKHSVLIAALLALALAGCQKQEEAPAPEMPGSEAPAPEVPPSEPMSEPGMAPSESMPPEEPAPGDMPATPPAQ
jgi:PBP1b-binding outer membrane lipoprotein LpoB